MIWEDEVSKFSAQDRLTRDLSGLGFTELPKGHVFTTCIQVSRPLLELHGRHLMMWHMMVRQVALFRQFAVGLHHLLFCSQSSYPQDLATLEVPFFSSLVQMNVVFKEQKRKIFVIRRQDTAFLMLAAQVVCHPNFHRNASGYAGCRSNMALADTQDSSSPTQHVPSWSFQSEWNTPKGRHVICFQAKSWTCSIMSFGVQFNGHTQLFHLREKTRWAHHLSQAHQI